MESHDHPLPDEIETQLRGIAAEGADPGRILRMMHLALSCEATRAQARQCPTLESVLMLPAETRTAIELHLWHCAECRALHGELLDHLDPTRTILPDLSPEEQKQLASSIQQRSSTARLSTTPAQPEGGELGLDAAAFSEDPGPAGRHRSAQRDDLVPFQEDDDEDDEWE